MRREDEAVGGVGLHAMADLFGGFGRSPDERLLGADLDDELADRSVLRFRQLSPCGP